MRKAPVRAYTLKELALIYHLSVRQMRRILKREGLSAPRPGMRKRVFLPLEVQKIFAKLGTPEITEDLARFL